MEADFTLLKNRDENFQKAEKRKNMKNKPSFDCV